mgnify:CR=1 FL=1
MYITQSGATEIDIKLDDSNLLSPYLKIAVDIGICLFCVFMIGRVGVLGNYLSLFLAFLVGDFSTLLLCLILLSTVLNIVFKKKVDMHHIFFIGGIFIFIMPHELIFLVVDTSLPLIATYNL